MYTYNFLRVVVLGSAILFALWGKFLFILSNPAQCLLFCKVFTRRQNSFSLFLSLPVSQHLLGCRNYLIHAFKLPKGRNVGFEHVFPDPGLLYTLGKYLLNERFG